MMTMARDEPAKASAGAIASPGSVVKGQDAWWLAPSKLLFWMSAQLSNAGSTWFDRCGDAIGRLMSRSSYFASVQRPRLLDQLETANNRPGRIKAKAALAVNTALTLGEGAFTAAGIIGLIIALPTGALAAGFSSVLVGGLAAALALPALPRIILEHRERSKKNSTAVNSPPQPYQLSPFEGFGLEGEDAYVATVTAEWDFSLNPGLQTGEQQSGSDHTVPGENRVQWAAPSIIPATQVSRTSPVVPHQRNSARGFELS